MRKAVQDFAQDPRMRDACSIVVVIMTHGTSTDFIGADGNLVNPYNDILGS
jgi:hypothetical protein